MKESGSREGESNDLEKTSRSRSSNVGSSPTSETVIEEKSMDVTEPYHSGDMEVHQERKASTAQFVPGADPVSAERQSYLLDPASSPPVRPKNLRSRNSRSQSASLPGEPQHARSPRCSPSIQPATFPPCQASTLSLSSAPFDPYIPCTAPCVNSQHTSWPGYAAANDRERPQTIGDPPTSSYEQMRPAPCPQYFNQEYYSECQEWKTQVEYVSPCMTTTTEEQRRTLNNMSHIYGPVPFIPLHHRMYRTPNHVRNLIVMVPFIPLHHKKYMNPTCILLLFIVSTGDATMKHKFGV
ncbi:uncharacterized protein KY384_000136 [Bacidia gigantensis]|uniref:uncharacterized protein n=1 Tax=Bacidia gigantensis TaxID=2732470 RepID=UPI001D056DF0|nr:uncharacterized protein KY384_000136 [Bacidia gigantensis]KAG8526143.1 hypothetical protein KY384_000136 [Bacidia gigantensis]